MERVGIKNDKYKKARGGRSRILDVACAKCSQHIFYYQKDGPGILKRTYLDRIYRSTKFEGLQNLALKKVSQLLCPKCQEHLGVPIIYKKENRLAFRIFEGAISKQSAKLK